MPDSRVLIIGGPEGEHVDGVDHIKADYIGLLGGAERPLYDYDFVIYWPGVNGLSLPKTRAQWLENRKHRPYLPEIAPAFWEESIPHPTSLKVPSLPIPEGHLEQPPEGRVDGNYLYALYRRLLQDLNPLLREIIAATEKGQVCICVLPDAMPAGLAGSELEWLSPYIRWGQVRPEEPHFDPPALPENQVVGLLAALTPVFSGLRTFRVEHTPSVFSAAQSDYGPFLWDELLFNDGMEHLRPEYEVWPQQQHVVNVVPGHTNRLGVPKSLLFLTGSNGGIALVPKPCSLSRMVDRILNRRMTEGRKQMQEGRLASMVAGKVTIRFSRDSNIKSVDALAGALDCAKSKSGVVASLGYSDADTVDRTIRSLRDKKKIQGDREALESFVSAAIEHFRSLPEE